MTTDADWFRTQCQIHRSIEDEMLALIERQAAEIVELTKANAQLFEHGKTMYAERERLRAAATAPAPMSDAEVDAEIQVIYCAYFESQDAAGFPIYPEERFPIRISGRPLHRAIFRAGRAHK